MVSAWFRLASETCLYKSCRTSGDRPASMEGPLGIFEKAIATIAAMAIDMISAIVGDKCCSFTSN
jgi:hypothetical protein